MGKLGSIISIQKGKKPKNTTTVSTDGYLPYVDIKAFEKKIVDNYADGVKCLPCEDGDLLIVCDGSRSGLVGKAIKGYVGSTLAKISADGLLNDYLAYFLQGNYQKLNTNVKGTGTPHVNQEILKNLELYVPTIPEQQKIVAKIEELFSELDKGVEELNTAKARLKVYRQAVLKGAFEGCNKLAAIKKISVKIFDGPFGSNLKTSDYVESGINVVRLENIKEMRYDTTKSTFISLEKYETLKKQTLFHTDLIMSTFISDAVKICQLPSKIKTAINKADCVCIRLKDDNNPKFYMYYLSTKSVFAMLSLDVHGATRPRINSTQIKNINVPIVAKEKQDEIVTEIESRLSVCDKVEQTIEEQLKKAESLRQSILKKAFEGRLI